MMNSTSPALYRAYTHLGSILDPAGEAQGSTPAWVTPRTMETEASTLNTIKSNANNNLAADMKSAASSLTPFTLNLHGAIVTTRGKTRARTG